MDQSSIVESLEACLSTAEEFAMGIEAWSQFHDPFPQWTMTIDEALAAAAAH